MKKMFLWFTVIVICFAVVTGFGLVGCKEEAASTSEEAVATSADAAEETVAEETTTEAAEKEPVTLKVLNWAPGGQEFWDATAAAFTKEYPWITIEYEAVPNTQYYEKQGAYISSRSGPDVMVNNGGFEMWDRIDAYQPVTKWMTDEVKNSVYNWTDACIGYNGANDCYGISPSYQGNVIYYNIAILKEAGVDPDNPPQTWEEFGAAAEKIKAIGKAPMAMGIGALPAYWVYPEIAKYFFTAESDLDAFMKGDIPWSDPRLKGGLEYLATWTQNDWFQDGVTTTQYLPDAGDVFLRGDAAFIPGIISDVFNWKVWGDGLGHENIGVMEWPVINPDAIYAGKFTGLAGLVHGVTAWTDKPEEAWLYVKWMASAQNADLFLKMAGGQPNFKGFDKSAIDYSPAFTKIQTIIEDNMPHIGTLLSSREGDAISRGFEQMLTKSITVDGWVALLQDALDNSETKQK